jgi:hypothetical protein
VIKSPAVALVNAFNPRYGGPCTARGPGSEGSSLWVVSRERPRGSDRGQPAILVLSRWSIDDRRFPTLSWLPGRAEHRSLPGSFDSSASRRSGNGNRCGESRREARAGSRCQHRQQARDALVVKEIPPNMPTEPRRSCSTHRELERRRSDFPHPKWGSRWGFGIREDEGQLRGFLNWPTSRRLS